MQTTVFERDNVAESVRSKMTEPNTVTTAIWELDRQVHMDPGTLTLIAAPPGVGKTGLIMQTLMETIRSLEQQQRRGKIALFSAEMTWLELLEREASYRAGIDVRTIRANLSWDMAPNQIQHNLDLADKLVDAMEELHNWMTGWAEIYIDESTNPPVDLMYEGVHEVTRDFQPLDLVAVDYLHLVLPANGDPEFSKGGFQDVREVSQDLAGLAKLYNVPVVCATQLNREAFRRKNNEPSLADLDMGGDRPASNVLQIMPHSLNTGPDAPENYRNLYEIHITKNRHGGLFEPVLVQREGTRFTHAKLTESQLDDLIAESNRADDGVPTQIAELLKANPGVRWTTRELGDELGETPDTIRGRLHEMMKGVYGSNSWLKKQKNYGSHGAAGYYAAESKEPQVSE